MKKEVSISSIAQMEDFANRLAGLAKPGMILALSGDLGAGKTTMTKFLAKALGVKRVVNSPTFTIMKSYSYPGADHENTLYHIDAYRLEGSEEDLGFEECFENGLCVVEWPQYLAELEGHPVIAIEIVRGSGEQERLITIEAQGDLEKVVEQL